MDRIDLGALDHVVKRMWVAQAIQGRQPVIRLGTLADGRWWASREGFTGTGVWVFGDEMRAEEAAHRWSERSGLRWHRVEADEISRR